MALRRGTSLRDTLVGTSGNDTLLGLGGNDTLTGKSGNDLLDGGKGADRMAGGLGNDTYIVDNTRDRVIESAGQGTDTVKSSVTFIAGAEVENLTLTGSKAINGTLSSALNEIGNVLTGNGNANVLTGGLGHDVLAGGLGADTLLGGEGNDTLIPGAGNGVADTINGGNGFDTVDYRDATIGVYVDIQSNGRGGGAINHTITGVESIVGSAFHDVLVASNVNAGGNPFAYGAGGNDDVYASTFSYDRIRGDDGFDVLFGDSGSTDDFWLQYDRGMDYVKGYRAGGLDDHIFIDHTEFNLSTTPGNFINAADFDTNVFASRPEFSGSFKLLFDTDTYTLWADKDAGGDAFAPVPIAMFDPGSQVNAGNIFVF
ncbi:MAG: calcium-binding protein [Hyphomicrobiaceae bacterium]